jgi:hypothetical protein
MVDAEMTTPPEPPDFLQGHEPLGRRPNIRKELRRIRDDPLHGLLLALGHDGPQILSNEFSRYEDAYWFYYLSMERFLNAMSIAARYSRGPYWKRRSGGTSLFTMSDHRLADQRRATARCLELDLTNCLIHTRILLDRTIALSRRFLTASSKSPSFTSFNEHKRFFVRLSAPYGEDDDYAKLIREETDWFEVPIKLARDKFVVHSAPKHMQFLGYSNGGFELDLNIMIPDEPDSEKPLAKMKVLRVNAIRMSLDIQRFLDRFAGYGLSAIARGAQPADAADAAAQRG